MKKYLNIVITNLYNLIDNNNLLSNYINIFNNIKIHIKSSNITISVLDITNILKISNNIINKLYIINDNIIYNSYEINENINKLFFYNTDLQSNKFMQINTTIYYQDILNNIIKSNFLI